MNFDQTRATRLANQMSAIRPTRSPWKLYRAGRDASRSIPGLPKEIRKSLLINLLLFAVLMAVINGSLYFLILRPLASWATDRLPDSIDFVPSTMVTLSLIVTMLVSLYLALRVSVILMGFWYEALVEKVLHHIEPRIADHKEPFDLGKTIGLSLKEIGITIGLLFFNFIPVIGNALYFLCTTHRSGLSAYEPYRAVLREHQLDEQRPKTKVLGLATIIPGFFILVLGLIPIAGWIALWWITMHLVIGVAWRHGQTIEISQAAPQPPSTPPTNT